MADILQPRSPYPAPSHPDGGKHISSQQPGVRLRHPGYPTTSNLLLLLAALDSPDGGIHHETVRISCAIVAGNRWDGFLSESRDGQAVQVPADGILHGDDYFFRVPGDDKYPVVPSFSHWSFPHGKLPPSWVRCAPPLTASDRALPRTASLTDATLVRDVSCRITNHIEGTEHAHLVPRGEAAWFRQNSMFQYASPPRPGTDPLDDSRNALLLRSDVHTLFDQRRFVFVPKSSVFVVHILPPGSSSELAAMYHNVQLQPLAAVAVEFLLARFAWAIFTQLESFVSQGVSRQVVVDAGDGSIQAKEWSGQRCMNALSTPKSRSQSPKKRPRDEAPPQEENDKLDDEEAARGRKRHRSFNLKLAQKAERRSRSVSDSSLTDFGSNSSNNGNNLEASLIHGL